MTHVVPLYGGAIQARQVGAFVMGGESFKVIRPGYCIQGKRRTSWTQIVHGDIPVFEHKIKGDVSAAIASFDHQWKRVIGDDKGILHKSLDACKTERRRKFRDGVTGEPPAPSIASDGRGEGLIYKK